MRKRFDYISQAYGDNQDTDVLEALQHSITDLYLDPKIELGRFIPRYKRLLSQLKNKAWRSQIESAISNDLMLLKKTFDHLEKVASQVSSMAHTKWIREKY